VSIFTASWTQNFSKFVSGGFLAVEKDVVPKGAHQQYTVFAVLLGY
jgi:hypothetical protein